MEGKQGVACRPFARNMHVKIKRSEITIESSMSYLALSVPRTGLEPARLSTLAPETSASTIPPPGLSVWLCKVRCFFLFVQIFGGNFFAIIFSFLSECRPRSACVHPLPFRGSRGCVLLDQRARSIMSVSWAMVLPPLSRMSSSPSL